MDKRILNYLDTQKISCLTTLLKDGSPHSATMHYAYTSDPFEFVFFTKTDSRKCSNLKFNETSPASLVIGFSEEEFKELQLEGKVEKIKREISEKDIQT
ncbi:pyridoxamine 5'-phosphate oxidase family protein, partial [Candidatus Microgenomates bacterium]|nr:pyridoxamine 5'-phosphate oxidase family protein [Candidatus Microgenomates bacterium]